MNRSLPLLSSLLLCLTAHAGQPLLLPPQTPPARQDTGAERDLCTRLKDLPWLYKKADNPVIQEFKLLITGQYQGAWVSPAGKNNFRKGSGGHNDEWRRAYLGFDVRLFNKKLFIHSMNDVGELDGQYKTRNGQWDRTETDWGIYELYAQYTEAPLAVKLGKIAPKMTGEYRTSSSEIKTIERSNMVNQLGSVSNWGLEFSSPGKDTPWGWDAGLFLNSSSPRLSKEIQFNTRDSAFLKLSVNYDTSAVAPGEKSRLWLTYGHDFAHYDGREIPAGSFYAGLGARDMISLDWQMTQGKWSLMAEAMAGFRVMETEDGKNLCGFSLIPAYRISPHFEGVFRYQISHGSDSVKVYSRYIPSVTTYPKWVDTLNSFYLGLNYYVCPDNPHMMKLMTGMEYTATERTVRSAKSFDGWTWMAALRFRF